MTTTKVTLVDYGSGNILSVKRALEYNNAEVLVTDSIAAIASSDRIVLPGVGAFGDCMASLESRKLIPALHEFIATERPFLGICVGMQALLERSYEFGTHSGLGIIPGEVLAIPDTDSEGAKHKIPHIGWSEISPPNANDGATWDNTILENTDSGTSYYFVHSMTAVPTNDEYRIADCDYNGRRISAAIGWRNVVGLQFHPEKSGEAGLTVLSKFLSS